ncbi:M14 family metallopeptidase [Pseudobacteriovorax antillogorgiicola]|uniref:Zinc carboxypeptidase n=1 Tax=Pseudobacteriovorax antillogorgiicola TaxID=1513793 RepID=A0A1Y6CM05_9BACT|nr:M14 family metallopeptidase [Pseudobacteriovorax antillogorgiicola]TCS44986.1 zinc carboxypeptidase [Pseudobacteriovorax antillogorgiicola]SMF76663.1 Zinc carboxypeptidase [Pseudobacteriovorax antillogorgiicola]
MIRLLLAAIGFLFWSPVTNGIQFNRYHDVSYINRYLHQVARHHPHVSIHRLGLSTEGRPIYYVLITKSRAPDTPVIYVNGTHHGNEKASTEASLGAIDYLSRKHRNIIIDRLLKKYVFLVHPLVNPDGHAANSRLGANGIDPNRDYPTPFSRSEPFQLRETKLVSSLMKKYRFKASAALHSGIEAVLWPWGSSKIASNHAEVFLNLGRVVAQAMKVEKYQQSYHDYKTTGEFIDYAYKVYGTYALTLEVSEEASPSPEKLPLVVSRSVKGLIALAYGLDRVELSH